MEKLIYCPKCNNKLDNGKCNNCNYIIGNEKLLIDLLHSKYNEAIELLNSKRIVEAFEKIKYSIKLYPYSIHPLKFYFYLSLEVGEYRKSFECLNQLSKFISKDEYDEMFSFLSKSINIYNSILNNKLIKLNLKEISFIHLYILYLKNQKVYNQREIISKLSNYDISFEKLEIKSFRKSKLVFSSFIFILFIGIIVLVINGKKTFNDLSNKVDKLENIQEKLVKEKNHLKKINQEIRSVDSMVALFSDNYKNGNYLKSAKIVINNPKIIKRIKKLKQIFLIEELCNKLYFKGLSNTVLQIDYNSKITPDAFYQEKIKEIIKSPQRIINIEEFVSKFPLNDWYTAPLLNELFYYYENRDHKKASQYGSMIKTYVEVHKEDIYKKWYSNRIKQYLQEGDFNEFKTTE